MRSDPARIWLQPSCGDACSRERCWAEDDLGPCEECGLPCTAYVAVDETEESEVVMRVERSVLNELRCEHSTCRGAPIGVYYVPKGCNCFRHPLQALCAQHYEKLHSTGSIRVVLDFAQGTES